jgi:hypothetical protein
LARDSVDGKRDAGVEGCVRRRILVSGSGGRKKGRGKGFG